MATRKTKKVKVKKTTKYRTIGGKKHVWRKGYTTRRGKKVSGTYVPLKKSRKRNPSKAKSKTRSLKKTTKYRTIEGKKHVWRKGYTSVSGKRVSGKYVPLSGAAKKAHSRKSNPRRRRRMARRLSR